MKKRRILILCLLTIALTALTACQPRPQESVPSSQESISLPQESESLFSDVETSSFTAGTPAVPENLTYDTVSAYYRNSLEKELPPVYYLYRTQDGVLQGYNMQRNEWETLGTLEPFELTKENFDDRFADDPILKDYPQTIEEHRLKARDSYHTVSGNPEYILTKKNDGYWWFTCLQDDTVMWYYQMILYDKAEEKMNLYADSSPDVLPPELTLDIFNRTYHMYIPSFNQSTDGVFAYADDQVTLVLYEDGSDREFHFLETDDDFIFIPDDSKGTETIFTEQLHFCFSSEKKSDGAYGTAELDIDGDGNTETVSVGNGWNSGTFSFCISADGIQDYFNTFWIQNISGFPEFAEYEGETCIRIVSGSVGSQEEHYYHISTEGTKVILTDEEGNRLPESLQESFAQPVRKDT